MDATVTERMAPVRRLTVVAAGIAALGVVSSVLGLVQFGYYADGGEGYAVIEVVSSVVMLAICAAQAVLWRRPADTDRPDEVRVSWILHAVSYAAVLAALVGGVYGSAAVAWTTTSAVWLTLAMVLVVMAQVLGAVQHVRADGPPGTIPTHVRRLAAWIEHQRRDE